MTGRLAPARHVPRAATRGSEPGSNPPHDAMLGSGLRTQANPTLAIDTFGRTKRDRSDSEDTPPLGRRKLKCKVSDAARIWG